MRAAYLLASAFLVGCASHYARPDAIRIDVGPVRLIPAPSDFEGPSEIPLYRVVVATAGTVDTVPGVLVTCPAVRLDAAVVGFGIEPTDARAYGFRYDIRTRQVARFDAPQDLRLPLSDVAISPDGRHMAYVTFPGDGSGVGVIRTLQQNQVIQRTVPVTTGGGDTFSGAASWFDSTHFQVLVMLDLPATRPGEYRWLRLRGAIGGPIVADTVLPARSR
jgi:hypothetical protein